MKKNFLTNIRELSLTHFGEMHYRAIISDKYFRRFYDQSRCVVSFSGTNGYPYLGSFCALKRCVSPYCNCKDCSYCVKY